MAAPLSSAAQAKIIVHAVQLVGQQAIALRAEALKIIAVLSEHQLEETDRLFLRKEKQLEDARDIIAATDEALSVLRDAGLQHIITLLGKSGQGKTTLINALLAATQASGHEYSTCGEQRADCVDLLLAALDAMKLHLKGPSAGSIIEGSNSTAEAAAALFLRYSHAVLQVIERSMHEATADLLAINKEDMLFEARAVVKKMQELQADLADDDVTHNQYEADYIKLFNKLQVLAAQATVTAASSNVSIMLPTQEWLDSEPTRQALEAAKTQKDPFIAQLEAYAVKAKILKEPFLLVTPPAHEGGNNACTFLNTEVRYGDVYSVKFTYFDEEALKARLYQIAIQEAAHGSNKSSSDSDDSSDDGSDSDRTADDVADIKCFNALCSSHRIRDPEETVKPPSKHTARSKGGNSSSGAGGSSSSAAPEAKTRSLAKPSRKEDIIINQALKQYFGKTVVYQGRGLNIHEDSPFEICRLLTLIDSPGMHLSTQAVHLLSCYATLAASTGAMTADSTERVLTNRAVEQANDGTVALICEKPLSNDTTVPDALMTFAFMKRLVKAAVDASADSTQEDTIVTAALKLMPRLLVVRNAEKADHASREAVVDLLQNAEDFSKFIELTQNSVTTMNETTEKQLWDSFKKDVGKGADKKLVKRVWTRFNERNSSSLSVLPHSFAASVLVDCVQLAGLTTTPETSSATDALLTATGIPDLITALIKPQLEVLCNLLHPLATQLDRVSSSVGVPEPTTSGNSTPDRPREDSNSSTTDNAAAAAAAAANDAAVVHGAVMSDEERTVVADVRSNATKVIKTKWARAPAAGAKKSKKSSNDHHLKTLERALANEIYSSFFADYRRKIKESAKELHKQALTVAEDKACIDAAVKRVTKLLETGGSKQKKNFEKRINPDLKGKAVLRAISNVPLNDALAAVMDAESEQFKALATGDLPGKERNLVSKYIMDTYKKADRASFVLSEKPKQSADYALQQLLIDLRDSDAVKTTKDRHDFLKTAAKIKQARVNMVNYLFNELTGQQFDGGFILKTLYTTAKNVLIRYDEPSRSKKADAAAAASANEDDQQQQANAKGSKGLGELFKATRKTIRKLAERAQEILDADDDAATAAAVAAYEAADNGNDRMDIDDDTTIADNSGGSNSSSTKATSGSKKKTVAVTPEAAARIQ
eukprot:15098-Heterococcus_DN1.PRE.1